MNKSLQKKLYVQIAALLKNALGREAEVSHQDGMIKVVISREVFEHRFGTLLHRIQQAIDEQHPHRTIDIPVLVRDAGSRFEHVFKIWKTSER